MRRTGAGTDENHNVFYHPTMSPQEIKYIRNWCLARFWNLDAVLEQFRLDQQRVGKFRMPNKLPLYEFLQAVFKKIKFAVDAGSELAEDHGELGNTHAAKSAKFAQHAQFMLDAWVYPHIAEYFKEHPMHEILDMRPFGKMFHGKRLQFVMEDRARRKCFFAMNVYIGPEGIDNISVTKQPTSGAASSSGQTFLTFLSNQVSLLSPKRGSFSVYSPRGQSASKA